MSPLSIIVGALFVIVIVVLALKIAGIMFTGIIYVAIFFGGSGVIYWIYNSVIASALSGKRMKFWVACIIWAIILLIIIR
jgi:hypothetical protein